MQTIAFPLAPEDAQTLTRVIDPVQRESRKGMEWARGRQQWVQAQEGVGSLVLGYPFESDILLISVSF